LKLRRDEVYSTANRLYKRALRVVQLWERTAQEVRQRHVELEVMCAELQRTQSLLSREREVSAAQQESLWEMEFERVEREHG